MREYGYGQQPYFIYFHHDTANNHVHILTTRVTRIGTVIPDHNDYRRLNDALNRVLDEDQDRDLVRMSSYSFTTEGQLMNIAREFNYKVSGTDDSLVFYHGGAAAFRLSRQQLAELLARKKENKAEQDRREEVLRRLKAVFFKYRELSLRQGMIAETTRTGRAETRKDLVKEKADPDFRRLLHSDGTLLTREERQQMNWFLGQIHSRLGIAVHFQKDKNGTVRGYSIVDHNNKVAVNGSDVMKLSSLIDFAACQKAQREKSQRSAARLKPVARIFNCDSRLDIYRPLFRAEVIRPDNSYLIRMELDGKEYSAELSENFAGWYARASAEEQEDIAVRMAVYYFHQQIYDAHIRRLVRDYILNSGFKDDIRKCRAHFFEQRNRRFCLSVHTPNDWLRYELTEAESKTAMSLRDDPSGRKAFVKRMLRKKILGEEAVAIARRIQYKKAGLHPAPTHKTPENVKAFVASHTQLMQRAASLLSARTGSKDENREYEVGSHSRYDDELEEERQRGMS